MKNKERVLFGLVCFLGGVVAGFLIAPIKEGIYCGNNNGNNNENYLGKDEEVKETTEENKTL